MPCCCSTVGTGRLTTRLSSVDRTSCMSCQLAPSPARPRGMPWPSVHRLRLTPPLARSDGFGPVFFPSTRRLGHRAVHAQPGPVNALELVKLCHPRWPALQENARFDPRLKPVMGSGFGTSLGLVQGFPLASRPEDVKHGIGTAAISDTGPPTPKAMCMHMYRKQGFQDGPQRIGKAEPGRRAVVWRACSCSFRSL